MSRGVIGDGARNRAVRRGRRGRRRAALVAELSRWSKFGPTARARPLEGSSAFLAKFSGLAVLVLATRTFDWRILVEPTLPCEKRAPDQERPFVGTPQQIDERGSAAAVFSRFGGRKLEGREAAVGR